MKLFVTFLIIACTCMRLQAQNNSWEAGFSGGIGLATLRSTINQIESFPIISYSAGISVEKTLNNQWSLYTSLNFERKGSQFEMIFTNDNAEIIGKGKSILSKEFITIPLLARYSVGKQKHFYFNAGPYLGISIQDVFTITYEGEVIQETVYKNINHKIDFGLSAGIGFKKNVFKKINLSSEIRYNHGLREVSKGAGIKNSNALFVLSLGRSF